MTNADRIRNMTDEELAIFMVAQASMGAMAINGINGIFARKAVRELVESKEAQPGIDETTEWLKQEVQEDE